MKKTQLLSVVFSLIMITGVTAGNTAVYAEPDEKQNDLKERLANICMLTDSEKEQFFLDHPRIAQFKDRLANFCNLSEDQRKIAIEAFIAENAPEQESDYNMADKMKLYCELSDADKTAFLAEHDKTDQKDRMDTYCKLDESGRAAYIAEHQMQVDDMQKRHEEIRDDKTEYQRFCEMSEDKRAAEITDAEKLMKISEWCAMTPEQKDQYKKEHHDAAMDFKEKHHDALDRMKENHDMSPRLRYMIMANSTISQEQIDELKAKYQEKHGDLDEKRAELRMKFQNHMSSMQGKLTDEQKADIKARHAEMKALKAELREKSSTLTDEEKQELRAEFIEKAKSMQLAWISPRQQVTAGIDAEEIECHEGFSLVMKTSNGLPMCVKADSALRMIENGFAIPAN
ncbi:MAG: ABC transporter substrate-binding protein [Nitrosopumilaceae archaeon]|nr:MAG: ABC transporter substrate-binding protein [Nitrosopumilaceae archaeon]